ncbi:MAG: putative sodium/proton antiporter [Labilithrix sp.]|nr:putative sodium/proton antiporter [Labilithrix sp.]
MDATKKLAELARVRPDDHVRGPGSGLTIVEYGDYECPHTRAAEPVLEELLAENPDVRFVYRHFPLAHLHPHAERLAAFAEAGGGDEFWERHERLMAGDVPSDLLDEELDEKAVHRALRDVAPARAAGVHSTPTFLFGAEKFDGAYDYDTLSAQLRAARRR